MQLGKQAWKRSLLALLGVIVALTWSGSGRAQVVGPCFVERGQDPLDVLNTGLRHNVWIILDTSGSMNVQFSNAIDTRSKLEVAKDVLNRLMDELVDGAGRPLVNWAFVPYDRQINDGNRCPAVPPDDNGDGYPDKPNACHGLRDEDYVNPGTCAADSRDAVRGVLNTITAAGSTPIGVGFTDIASYLIGQHVPDSGSGTANTTDFVSGLLPNQKNYVIHVTDGQDTCECTSGGYPSDPANPLVTPVNMRPDQSDPDAIVSSGDAGDIASFNAGLKGEFALEQIDPALDGSKGNIFTIGMDLDQDDKEKINTIAWMASGANLFPQRDRALMNAGFFADDPEQLVQAFMDVFARIGLPESEIFLGAPVVSSVKEVIHSHTNTSLQQQDVIPFNLSDAEAVRIARSNRADHRNNVMFVSSVDIPQFRGHLRATHLYRVTDESQPRSSREEDLTELWDAGIELQDDDPDARRLLFNKRGSRNLLSFDSGNVTPSDLGVGAGYLSNIDGVGALTASDARDIVVKVIRGYRLSVDPLTNRIYDSNGDLNFSRLDESGNPTWKLYESTANSVAVVSNPPRSPDFDPPLRHASEYGVGGAVEGDGFYWEHLNRRTMVYYSSNAGILHGFDGETGAEVFGYIPDDALGLDPGETPGSRDTLKDFVALLVAQNNGIINHNFLLSGSPSPADAFLRGDQGGDDQWHTVLAFGRGRGGRFLTMLDITEAPSPDRLRLLWNRGNREGIVEGLIDGLGETWSTPVMGNVDTRGEPGTLDTRVDQWLAFAGGGYGCDNDENEGRSIFAFRVENGDLYFEDQVTTDPLATIPNNALPAMPTLFNPHRQDVADSKDYVTRVYIPDLQGRVWKLMTDDPDPANWTLNVFAEMGLEHPITAPVTVMKDSFTPNRVIVMAGSGGDRRAPPPPGGFKFRAWVDLDPDGQNTTQHLAEDTPLNERVFNENERMFNQAVTVGLLGDAVPPLVFFNASRESFDTETCVITFNSTLYVALVTGGQPNFDLDPASPGSDSVDLGASKVQGTTSRDGMFYISLSGGLGVDGHVEIWGDEEDLFSADAEAGGGGQYTIQLLTEGFRISPF